MATLGSIIEGLYTEDEHQEFQVLVCALLERNLIHKKQMCEQQYQYQQSQGSVRQGPASGTPMEVEDFGMSCQSCN